MEATTMHIMVTSLCVRDCEYCCNKQYDLNDIPYATTEELDQVKHVYITGGEPFLFSNPCLIARKLKGEHRNIEAIGVYTNATELFLYLVDGGKIHDIDGLTISIKNNADLTAFVYHIANDESVLSLPRNRLYVFPRFEDTPCPDSIEKMVRTWQKEFVPAPNSVFRKL